MFSTSGHVFEGSLENSSYGKDQPIMQMIGTSFFRDENRLKTVGLEDRHMGMLGMEK